MENATTSTTTNNIEPVDTTGDSIGTEVIEIIEGGETEAMTIFIPADPDTATTSTATSVDISTSSLLYAQLYGINLGLMLFISIIFVFLTTYIFNHFSKKDRKTLI